MSTKNRWEFPLGDLELFSGGWPARIFGILLGIAGWQALATVFPNELMPFPIETMLLTWELVETGVVWRHLAATAWRILWGFVGSMVAGILLGVLMGTSGFRRAFLTPYILVGLAIPAIAWAVISLLVFGFSEMAIIVATIGVTFPFIAVNVWKGVESIDWDLVQMSKAFDVSSFRLLHRLILPNIAGSLMTAVRYGLAITWKIVTITEVFATKGIGLKLINSYNAYQFERAWAWAVVFMIVILLIEYGVFRPLERRVFRYRSDADFAIVG